MAKQVLRYLMVLALSSYSLAANGAGGNRMRVYENHLKFPNPEQLDVFLITFGQGHRIHTLGGHALLRIKNNKTGTDRVFNWGTFNPYSPTFLIDFYQGILDYKLEVRDTKHYMRVNRASGIRNIVSNQLLLNPKEKQTLLDSISEWTKPENRYYRYHIWENNCSTLVRDLISKAVDGKVKSILELEKTTESYRDLWEAFFGLNPWISGGANLLFNGEVDASTTLWDQGFIPQRLLQGLRQYEVISGFKLLGPEEEIAPGKEFSLPVPSGNSTIALLLLFPILIGVIAWGIAGGRRRNLKESLAMFMGKELVGKESIGKAQDTRPERGVHYGYYGVLWGVALIGIIVGTILWVNTAWTNRSYFHYSGTMLLVFPLDFLLFMVPLLRSRKIHPSTLKTVAASIFILSVCHVAGALAYGAMMQITAVHATLLVFALGVHGPLGLRAYRVLTCKAGEAIPFATPLEEATTNSAAATPRRRSKAKNPERKAGITRSIQEKSCPLDTANLIAPTNNHLLDGQRLRHSSNALGWPWDKLRFNEILSR